MGGKLSVTVTETSLTPSLRLPRAEAGALISDVLILPFTKSFLQIVDMALISCDNMASRVHKNTVFACRNACIRNDGRQGGVAEDRLRNNLPSSQL